MMNINLLRKPPVDHGGDPHLCVLLTNEEFIWLQGVADRARVIYGKDLRAAVIAAFKEYERELAATGGALLKRGLRPVSE